MTTDHRSFRRRLDWNLLHTFHEIVQAGGVSAAAGALGRNQPALSLALKRLETAIGARLCWRGPGGFELTDEGVLVAETCVQLSRLVGEVPYRVANVSDEVQGQARVMMISNLVNPDLDAAIAAFHTRYPQLGLVVGVSTWYAIGRAVLRDEADIGIAPGDLIHSELDYRPLFDEVHRVYCGATHPRFGSAVGDPAELAGDAFVLTGADEPSQLTKYRLRLGLGREVAGITEHLEEARRLLQLGMGIGFLPEGFARPDVERGRLWPLTVQNPDTSLRIYAITNPKAPRRLPRIFLLNEIEQAYAEPPGPKH